MPNTKSKSRNKATLFEGAAGARTQAARDLLHCVFSDPCGPRYQDLQIWNISAQRARESGDTKLLPMSSQGMEAARSAAERIGPALMEANAALFEASDDGRRPPPPAALRRAPAARAHSGE